MPDKNETTNIQVRVHFMDTIHYREYAVSSDKDWDFNEAGTLLAVRLRSVTDESSVTKLNVVIPTYRIKSVEIRYFDSIMRESEYDQTDMSTGALLLSAGKWD